MLLKYDYKKEIKFIEVQEISEKADLIFNIIESFNNKYIKIVRKPKKMNLKINIE